MPANMNTSMRIYILESVLTLPLNDTPPTFCLLMVSHCSVDPATSMAGGTGKFLNPVLLLFNGQNIWSSPAVFKASCQMKVQNWPFDIQRCSLQFGSMSQRSSEFTIREYTPKSSRFNGNVFQVAFCNFNSGPSVIKSYN